MKKLLTFLFAILFAAPCFATGVSGDSATCDSGTLSTDTGPTNLRANYESNTLNLKWYDENGNQLNVQNESNTCTYGGSINLPTPPEKKGYTFKGWKVFYQYDFSTLDTSIDGTAYNSNQTAKTWDTIFPYGIIYGRALCSQTSGNFAIAGTPDESGDGDTRYCWCQVLSYKNTSNNVMYEPTSSLPWVFLVGRNSTSNCALNCTYPCADYVRLYPKFRRAIFGVTH